jgi:transcriptional regulator GlxA family with amidase domain
MRNVAILLFDEVEVLDFAGPFEVFTVAARVQAESPAFNVYTVAQASPVNARGGLTILPQFTFMDCPRPAILLVPGGRGTRPLLAAVLAWIIAQAAEVEHLLSVCTGALLLGKAGLLDGLVATTYHTAFDLLREVAPGTTVDESRRFVDNGRVITSAGVSAGIDMALYVVARLLGEEHARATADHMEYRWLPE